MSLFNRRKTAQKNYPLILVTSGRLGSINHTLLSLEAISKRNIKLYAVAYNLYPKVDDDIINRDTEDYVRNVLREFYPNTRFITIPSL